MSRKLKAQVPAPKQRQNKGHFEKPLTNEQKFENLKSHVNQLYKIIDDVNSRLIALSRAKVEPKSLASFMREGDLNSIYMRNLNSELDAAAAEESKKQNEALKGFEVPNDNGPTMEGSGPAANEPGKA